MATTEGNTPDNPVKGNTPRQGNTWWILILILLIAVGLFWAFGRSDRDVPANEPIGLPTTHRAVPDQIDNTVRADGHSERVQETLLEDEPARVTNE